MRLDVGERLGVTILDRRGRVPGRTSGRRVTHPRRASSWVAPSPTQVSTIQGGQEAMCYHDTGNFVDAGKPNSFQPAFASRYLPVIQLYAVPPLPSLIFVWW